MREGTGNKKGERWYGNREQKERDSVGALDWLNLYEKTGHTGESTRAVGGPVKYRTGGRGGDATTTTTNKATHR